MDLPTYTNIWRIEKRLYKLYDFRLPAPLPITWIGVFVGITVPYVLFLIAVGLPFNHNLVWLYILPPGVLTWLTTRPVIESKRLPELVSSQLRYVAEPRTWCRMAPFAEKEEILVTARVWHQHPPKARPKKTKKAVVEARSAVSAPQLAEPGTEEVAQPGMRSVKARRAVTRSLAVRQTAPPPALPPATSPVAEPVVPPSPEQLPEQVPVQERALARRAPKRARAGRETRPSWSPWPHGPEPRTESVPDVGQAPEADRRPSWAISPPPAEMPETRALEVAHDSDHGFPGPDVAPASFGPASWPSPEVNLLPLVRPRPESAPFPEAGAFPEVGPFPDAGPFPDIVPFPGADAEPGPAADAAPAPGSEHPSGADPAAALRSGIASARRHLSGLMPSLVRKPDQSAGSPQPPAETSVQATSGQATSGQAASVWSETPAATPAPRARWMLRVQAHPPSAPAEDLLGPSEPLPAVSLPAGPASAAPEAAALDVEDPQAEVSPPPVTEVPAPEGQVPEAREPEALEPEIEEPEPEAPVVPFAARIVGMDRERPLPSIERALSGPGCRDELSWRRQVKVVAGGQGPGKRDQEALDRARVRTPLTGPRRIVVLGCTRGAGQTVTALMTSHILATVRGVTVAALDLNPGPTSLAARRSPAASVSALLAGEPGQPGEPGDASQPVPGARLDVIADQPGHNGNVAAHTLDGDDFRRLTEVLAERYPLTMIDPAASGLTRVLSAADQLVLVAPASPDAATSLANTQQWLAAHGHGELASRAITVVNGVSRRTQEDVLRAESVARGRCRAIVRVPWDDLLSPRPGPHHQTTLQPQTRLAYTALAGVLVTGLAAVVPGPSLGPLPGRNPGEHSG